MSAGLIPVFHVRPLFTGTLEHGERIGECHRCGRPITRDAGTSTSGLVDVMVCIQCADAGRVLLSAARGGDGEGCACGRPVACTCGVSCTLCGGLLPSSGGP